MPCLYDQKMNVFLSVTSQLLLVGCCLSAPLLNSTGQSNVTNFHDQHSKFTSVSTDTSQSHHSLSNVDSHKITRKREIPDALVDHPEDFDDTIEEARENNFEILPQADEFVLPPSNLDDVEAREYYGSEENNNRKAFDIQTRRKRNLQINPETAEILLHLLNSGAREVEPPSPRMRYPWTSIAAEPEVALQRNLLQELYNNRGTDDSYSDDFYPQRRVFPIPKIPAPIYERNIL